MYMTSAAPESWGGLPSASASTLASALDETTHRPLPLASFAAHLEPCAVSGSMSVSTHACARFPLVQRQLGCMLIH